MNTARLSGAECSDFGAPTKLAPAQVAAIRKRSMELIFKTQRVMRERETKLALMEARKKNELPRLRWPYVVFSVCAIAFAWVCLGGPLP